MAEPSFKQKLRYRFDNFMARGGSSIFIIITVAFIIGYIIIGLIRAVIITLGVEKSQHGENILHQIYITFLQMTAPGNMNQDIDSSPLLKVPTILAGVFGIVLFSALIGFITTSLRGKLDELRKGRSQVIENDHSLILGWNDQRIVEILRELILSNESDDNPVVVILADKEKEEMDDFLALNLPDTDNTRIVTRSGITSSQAILIKRLRPPPPGLPLFLPVRRMKLPLAKRPAVTPIVLRPFLDLPRVGVRIMNLILSPSFLTNTIMRLFSITAPIPLVWQMLMKSSPRLLSKLAALLGSPWCMVKSCHLMDVKCIFTRLNGTTLALGRRNIISRMVSLWALLRLRGNY